MSAADTKQPAATGGAALPDELDSACRLLRVTGRVQGVFFRASTQTAARDLGLTGYAKNLDDGSVEVLACGGTAALDALARWLREGPPMARVDSLTECVAPWRDLVSFDTL